MILIYKKIKNKKVWFVLFFLLSSFNINVLIMNRIESLLEHIDCLEDEIFFTGIALGDSWFFTDEYFDLYNLLDGLYFELELLELLDSEYIKN